MNFGRNHAPGAGLIIAQPICLQVNMLPLHYGCPNIQLASKVAFSLIPRVHETTIVNTNNNAPDYFVPIQFYSNQIGATL